MKKGVRITIILVFIVVVLGVSGYFAAPHIKTFMEARGPRGGAADQEESFSVPVAVTRVKAQPMQETLILYGTVFPQNEVNIFATVTGKVKKVLVREGDYVAKDQSLATIDRDQAGLKFAEAEVTSTIPGNVGTGSSNQLPIDPADSRTRSCGLWR